MNGLAITAGHVRELLARIGGLGLTAPEGGSLTFAITDADGRLLATTTVGEDCGWCMLPAKRQRSAVRTSIDKPRSRSNGGVRTSKPARTAMTRAAAASRNRAEPVIMRRIRRY